MTEGRSDEPISMPALLRAARTVFGGAIRRALADVGCDDLPRNGAFVLGALSRGESPLSEVITYLGISKQAAGQLVDTLVARGYLDRSTDPVDRRRLLVGLTPRGEGAAATIRAAVDEVEAALVARVGQDDVDRTRATLTALIVGDEHVHDD